MTNYRFLVALVFYIFLVVVPHSTLGQDSQDNIHPDFTLTLVGDSIIETPVSVHQDDQRFMTVVNAVRAGDARFTNLELTYPSRNAYPAGKPRNSWISSDPSTLKELQWLGFNLFATANNHSLDYGIQGLLDTLQVLQNDHAVYAGLGENLGEARAPGYLSTPKGRVALIACASTILDDEIAGASRPDLRGRPGVNPLRVQTRYLVDRKSLEALRDIKTAFQIPESAQERNSQSVELPFPASSIYPLRVKFELSDHPGILTAPDPTDLAALTHSIRDAKGMADYVVASIHAHEGAPGPDPRSIPAQFITDFAHAAIDAGADVVVGHGPHVLRGIEIYRGKVILYSLGNFIFENWLVTPNPSEFYTDFGLGPNALPSELYDARSDHERRDEPANPLIWQSLVAEIRFINGRPAKVVLTPASLGFGRKRPDRGVPQLATPEEATKIFDRLQKLSRAFGTDIVVKNGVGTIVVGN